MTHAYAHKGKPAHTHTHVLSTVGCVVCFVVMFFSWQARVTRVSVRACLPVCVRLCGLLALSIGLLLPALNVYILFTNFHHYCDYHHITEITFIKRATS